MSHSPKHFDEITSLFSASCPFGKLSVRQNVRSAKRPFGKTSVRQNVRRQNVRSAKCPFGKMSFGKMSFGKVSFGKMSGYRLQAHYSSLGLHMSYHGYGKGDCVRFINRGDRSIKVT